jgi:hypothetical protein
MSSYPNVSKVMSDLMKNETSHDVLTVRMTAGDWSLRDLNLDLVQYVSRPGAP